MTEVFAFAVVLLIAVLVSGLAHRSLVSTAVLFLVAGFLLGDHVFNVVSVQPENPVLSTFVELALFSILFVDGMHIGLPELRQSWRLPGRALLVGMPLTFVLIAIFAYALLSISWTEAFLIGAVLSPTDPVFAAALVGRGEVPLRLRRLLNVESGLNDGLALPVVIILLTVIGGDRIHYGELLFEIALGVALGIAIPWIAIHVQRLRWFDAQPVYVPIYPFAIGLVVYALTSLTQANPFLAAFAAGVTVATMSPRFTASFHEFGGPIAEILKLAALFLFGALVSIQLLTDIGLVGDIFIVLAIFIARPLVIALVLIGTELERRERIAAMWFGPKGFASVAYGLLVLDSGIPNADRLFHIIATMIIVSIILHSSTDAFVASWFTPGHRQSTGQEPGPPGYRTPANGASP